MEHIFSKIPLELIEHCIVPYCPLTWLFVSKKWSEVAVHNIVNEPYIIAKSSVILKETILARNYPLASVLVTDPRYTQPTSLDLATGAAYEDKTSNMILLKHSNGAHIMRIFQRAIKLDWLDAIEYIINNNKLESINISAYYYKIISPEALQLFIEDPKLPLMDKFVFREAAANSNPKVAEICLKAKKIDLFEIVQLHAWSRNLLDAVLKLPTVYEPNNIQTLWEALSYCTDDRLDIVKDTISKYNLDPSVNLNYGLRRIIANSSLHSSRKIVKLILDDERVSISLQPYDMNPLFIAVVNAKRDVIPILLEHPKIKTEWIDDFLMRLIETEESAYGLEVISRKLSHLVTNKALLDLIPKTIENIKQYVVDYYYFYEPDYWSEEDELNNSDDQ